MLQIVVNEREFYDESKNEFVKVPFCKLNLEHSLVSISKWEAKWHKPFLSSEKTNAELIDYIRCMVVSPPQVDELVFSSLTNENVKSISDYINNSMTATTFTSRSPENKKKEIVTSELIYYWMVAYQIPFECQKWHINRLMTLIRICGIKNSPNKKMNKNDVLRQNASLNAARRASLGTRG